MRNAVAPKNWEWEPEALRLYGSGITKEEARQNADREAMKRYGTSDLPPPTVVSENPSGSSTSPVMLLSQWPGSSTLSTPSPLGVTPGCTSRQQGLGTGHAHAAELAGFRGA